MVNYDSQRVASLVSGAETATTNRTKGESFADLVEHVFAEVPGVALAKRGHLDADRAAEIDLIFRHNPLSSGLPFEGVTVFIECKNEARKIGAAQVRNFGSKLRRRNQRYGVMVSRMGLSGTRATAGHAAISEELAQGRSIVVLCLDDVRALTSTDDFLELLHDRLTELHIETTYTSI